MTEESSYHIPLFKAVLTNDWEAALSIFDQYPEADTAAITVREESPLHIAVSTNSSHLFVENLVARIFDKDPTKLRQLSSSGISILEYAARVGNTTAVRLLLEKDPDMAQRRNAYHNTALKLAAYYAHKETLLYLLEKTRDEIGVDYPSPYRGQDGGDLIKLTISAGYYDVALYLVEKYLNLAWERDSYNSTALQTLATKSNAFPSGSRPWFWQNIIYSCVPLDQEIAYSIEGERQSSTTSHRRTDDNIWSRSVCFKLNLLFWRVLKYLAPFIKHIYEEKIRHVQTRQLVNLICTKVMQTDDRGIAWHLFGPAISIATTYGVYELVEECLRCYPDIVWYRTQETYLLILTAVKHRQEKVYNLLYQMSGYKVFAISNTLSDTYEEENALHIVARLAPSHRLNTVTGAALQMQRELEWFKEVQKVAKPSSDEELNREKKTPRMIFTDEHAELIEKGEKWMKDTASSSSVAAALIVTVAFAAAFTVPGGNDTNGTPLFLKENIFMLFAISDAIALFSSSTSLLMFLSILTSRYAEEDFLYALPKRLTIGLLSLFVSIAATMIAFSATLALVLRHEIAWIALPLGLMASVPITLFALLQFPLLVELVVSTYGKSIFHKQNNLLLR